MYRSELHKLVFVAVPRAASRATATMLTKHYEFSAVGNHHKMPKTEAELRGYKTIITVRNPFTRAVSMYWYYTKQAGGQAALKGSVRWGGTMVEGKAWRNFEQFLGLNLNENWWTMRQSRWHDNIPSDNVVFARVEDFPNSLAHVLPDYNPEFGPPVLHKGEYGDWREYYTPSLVKRVQKLYAEDFKRYGYELEMP